MELISREEAKTQGLRFYFTGIECKHGHLTVRRVSSTQCEECRRLISNKFNTKKYKEDEQFREKRKQYAKEWRSKNQDYLPEYHQTHKDQADAYYKIYRKTQKELKKQQRQEQIRAKKQLILESQNVNSCM